MAGAVVWTQRFSILPATCPSSSQMVVWLKKGELPRVVTRYGEEQPQLGPRFSLCCSTRFVAG